MKIIEHKLRREIKKNEYLVTYIQGGQYDEENDMPQTEIELAIPRADLNIYGNAFQDCRTDEQLCEIAWNMLEKDRFIANGLRVEDCIGYQLGVRSGMVGDCIIIHENDISKRYYGVAIIGFKSLSSLGLNRLLGMSISKRHFEISEME